MWWQLVTKTCPQTLHGRISLRASEARSTHAPNIKSRNAGTEPIWIVRIWWIRSMAPLLINYSLVPVLKRRSYPTYPTRQEKMQRLHVRSYRAPFAVQYFPVYVSFLSADAIYWRQSLISFSFWDIAFSRRTNQHTNPIVVCASKPCLMSVISVSWMSKFKQQKQFISERAPVIITAQRTSQHSRGAR